MRNRESLSLQPVCLGVAIIKIHVTIHKLFTSLQGRSRLFNAVVSNQHSAV